MRMQRVAICCAAMVTPLGHDVAAVLEKVRRGDNAFEEVPGLSSEGCRSSLAGRVDLDGIRPWLPSRRFLRLPPHDQIFAAVAQRCLTDAGLMGRRLEVDPDRLGLFLGTSRGPLDCVEAISTAISEGRPREVDPLKFQQTVLNAPLGHFSIQHKISGPCVTFSNGNVSAVGALDAAIASLGLGEIDFALVAGVDTLSPGYYRAMSDLRVLSPQDDSPEGSRPFAVDRNGAVVSEGAACVLLRRSEDLPASMENEVLRVTGVGFANDGGSYWGNAPDGQGFALAIREALREAAADGMGVATVWASAAGNMEADAAEAKGLEICFGDRLSSVAVWCPKASWGEMGSASVIASLGLVLEGHRRGDELTPPGWSPVDPIFESGRSTGAGVCDGSLVILNESSRGGLNAAVVLNLGSSGEGGE